MNIGERFAYINYISNKEQSGRTLTPEQFNLQDSEAENDFFRSIARPGADQFHSWSVLKGAVDDMRLRTLKRTVALALSNGLADYPTDFRDWLSFGFPFTKTICGEEMECESAIEIVEEDEWAQRLCHPIRIPTVKYPILKFNATQIEVRPTNASPVRMTYYKISVAPVFAFTLDANENIIYNSGASIQSEYPEITHVQICNILLNKIGINLSFEQLRQYANEAKIQV